VAQVEIHLAVTRIDGDDTTCSMLQKTIREAAGGRADVEADFARDVDLPVFQSALQFDSTAAHILQIFAEKSNYRFGINLSARLFNFLVIDENLSCQNEGLGSFA
jgi:hypothetical protein